jgi:two-component system, OmpR family, sensor kinase
VRSRRSGLTTQLVVSHVLVIALATLFASFGLLSLAKQYFVDADRKGLLTQARLVALSCDQACLESGEATVSVSSSQLPVASNAITQRTQNASPRLNIGRQQTVTAALQTKVRILKAGSAIADYPPQSPAGLLVTNALSGNESSRQLSGEIVVGVPIRRDDLVVGAAIVSQDLSDVNALVGDLRQRSLLAAAFAIVAAGLVALLRARSLTRPIRALQQAAHGLAAGDFQEPIPDHGRRTNAEIADLTASFETMRTQVRDQLEKRDEFVADASHELRTPLTALRGYLELLHDGAAEKPDVRSRFLGSMEAETNRLIRLVDDLLVLSRSDTGALSLRVERLDPFAFTRELIDDLQPLAASRQRTLMFVQPLPSTASVPTVEADRDRLRQILVNLIDNGLAHAQTMVQLSVLSTAMGTKFLVTDDGPGIAPEDHEAVFERFRRLDESRVRDGHGGAGLGLAIVRSLVQAHGGTVDVSALGSGATFTVHIPGR